MNRQLLLLTSVCALFVAGLRNQFATANVEGATGTHGGVINRKADAALTLTHLVVKSGSDAFHVAVCGATDYPLGTTRDQPEAAEDIIGVDLLASGPTGTRRFRCATAIAANADLFTAASGLVSTTGTAGMYKVGRSIALAVQVGTSDYIIEAIPLPPIVVP